MSRPQYFLAEGTVGEEPVLASDDEEPLMAPDDIAHMDVNLAGNTLEPTNEPAMGTVTRQHDTAGSIVEFSGDFYSVKDREIVYEALQLFREPVNVKSILHPGGRGGS